MKRSEMGKVVFCVVLFIIAFAVAALAAGDVKSVEGKVVKVTEKQTKTGKPMVIILIESNGETDGVKYTDATPMFAFDQHIGAAKTVKEGETRKFAVRVSPGKNGGTVMTFLGVGNAPK